MYTDCFNTANINLEMFTDILLPEITSAVDRYLNDTDRLRLLATFKAIHSIGGFSVSEKLYINKVHGTYLYSSAMKLKIIISDTMRQSYPVNSNVESVSFEFVYDQSTVNYIDKLPKETRSVNVILEGNDTPLSDRITAISYNSKDPLNIEFPRSVTHLKFGRNFNEPIDGCIPNSVTHLKFGYYFNRPINGCIPNSVIHLEFGYVFNQPIDDCIPNSVTHLKFGYLFDQPINGCIPNSVTHLKFGQRFDQSINGCIPNSVTHLTNGK